jgi:hypothetical protein
MDDQRDDREGGLSEWGLDRYDCDKCRSTDMEVVHTKTLKLTLPGHAVKPEFDRLEFRCRQCGWVGVLFGRKKT